MTIAKITEGKKDKRLVYRCPGCEDFHSIPFEGGKTTWEFNGDLNSPTLNPSVLGYTNEGTVCHHFLRNGVVEFCADDPNKPGQRIPLPELNL